MAVPNSRGRAESFRQWKDRETSPERTMVWKEPRPRKVPVVYYLSRNGQLEHPHFMEVPLSSTADGLFLRDVLDRLNFLRGKGIANLYSWSSKRSYKNGFVWQDLSEDDLIQPAFGHEYVLKGSELLRTVSFSRAHDSSAAFFAEKTLHYPKSAHEIRRSRAHWSSFDLHEYKVYKTDLTAEAAALAADASTQTEDGSRGRREGETPRAEEEADPPTTTTELERDDMSPPPSSSSTETLETLVKTDSRVAAEEGTEEQDQTVGSYAGGRMRASAVLMHLLSCGSISMKGHRRLSESPPAPPPTPPPCKERAAVTRGGSDLGVPEETECLVDGGGFAGMTMDDVKYRSRWDGELQ